MKFLPALTALALWSDAEAGRAMELEARRTAGMIRALENDTGDPPDTII